MIKPFPDEHELVSFFDVVPTYSEHDGDVDNEIPKAYQKATYRIARGASVVTFTVEQASAVVHLEISSDSGPNLRLDLHRVDAIVVEAHPRVGKSLVVKMNQPEVRDLWLRLAPTPLVSWGTEMLPRSTRRPD